MAFLGLAPTVAAATLDQVPEEPRFHVTEARGDFSVPVEYRPSLGPLLALLRSVKRPYNPHGGDFGRGAVIESDQLPQVATILRHWGYLPYFVDSRFADDEFGEPFPLFGCSGAVTGLVYRVWVKPDSGTSMPECIPIEYISPIVKSTIPADPRCGPVSRPSFMPVYGPLGGVAMTAMDTGTGEQLTVEEYRKRIS